MPRQPAASEPAGPDRLVADCGNCFGLCCVALPFARSTDFPIDKRAGEPCRNLRDDFRCGIHATLRADGFRGCTVFDCFGAGQQVSQVTFGGRDWRQAPETAQQMFDVFAVMRQLHEMLALLTEATGLAEATGLTEASDHVEDTGLGAELARVRTDVHDRTNSDAATLLALDVAELRGRVGELLRRTSERVRGPRPKARPRGDLVGANLQRADLQGADLRGGCLIAANLGGADLRRADLLGADLRDANLAGADLSTSLFLTQAQLNAAAGDAATRIPARLARPAHWAARGTERRTGTAGTRRTGQAGQRRTGTAG